MTKSLRPAIAALEDAYDSVMPIVTERFGTSIQWGPERGETRKVPRPIITLQRQRQRSNSIPVYGWYRSAAWESDTEDVMALLAGDIAAGQSAKQDEINLVPDGLSRSKVEILTTLLAQCIHHYASVMQTGQTVNSKGYHTDLFGRYARAIGFDVEHVGAHGYAGLTPLPRLTKKLEDVPLDMNAFDLVREREEQPAWKGSDLKKWRCGCTNVRVATYLEAVCLHCGKPFTYADKDKDDQATQHKLANAAARHARMDAFSRSQCHNRP